MIDHPRPKPIRLSAHACSYFTKRGFTAAEVEQAIQSSPWEPSQLGRLQCSLDMPYNQMWNGKHYATKRIRPIFIEEETGIVVVTVYTYYF
ncbi:MAG: hypothetical protein WC058_12030 [Phycisphaeraceae bacterium]